MAGCYDKMEVREPCFCCQPSQPSASGTLDSALNELGMLSTVTDSRRQFLLETKQRDRSISEPSQDALACVTPLNSPVKGGYHIVQLNTSYVVGVTRIPTVDCDQATHTLHEPRRDHCMAYECLKFGEEYYQDATEYEARTNRMARIKFGRSTRRFKRPYELPWHNRAEDQSCHLAVTSQTRPASSSNLVGLGGETACVVAGSSNPCTPEKAPGGSVATLMPPIASTVTRSKSLDELDFAQLRLNSENDNCSFVVEQKEMERMSQTFLHLQVNE